MNRLLAASLAGCAFALIGLAGCSGPTDPDTAATPQAPLAVITPTPTPPAATPTATTRPTPSPAATALATPSATSAPQPSPAGTPARPTATPSVLALNVGQKQDYANGTSITVYAVQPYTASLPSVQPGPNDRVITIDAEVCAGSSVSGLTVSASQFALAMSDGSSYPGLSTGRTPVLGSQGILPGACSRGWVTVQLPKSPDPLYIVADLRNYEIARWAFKAS